MQIKYFRIADAILDQAAEEQEKQRAQIRSRGGSRGGRGQGNRGGMLLSQSRWLILRTPS
jgi:U6 snRNA-associated Sm-like protein LSm4